MNVHELNKEQFNELKERFFYTDFMECKPHGIEADTWEDLPDDIILEWYDGISFVNDDFFCSMGE